MNVATPESVQALKIANDQAHERFSRAHWKTQEAQQTLKNAANRLSELVMRRRAAERSLTKLVHSLVQDLASDPTIKVDAPKIAFTREEVKLLDAAIAKWKIEGHADAEHCHLASVVKAAEAQLEFEQRRLDLHEAQVNVLLGSAAELDGGIELARPGAVTVQLREIVGDLRDKLTRARATLRDFDEQLAKARAQYDQQEATRG